MTKSYLLYFVKGNNDREFVDAITVDDFSENEIGKMFEIVDNDMKARVPDFKSYYKRWWRDDDDAMWIDFGSHTEFYVATPVDDDCEMCAVKEDNEDASEN